MRSFWDDQPVRAENNMILARLEPRQCLGIRIDKKH
jgi:hypothetical protein